MRYVLDLSCDARRADRRLDLRRGRDRDRFDAAAGGSRRRATARSVDYRAALDVKAPLPGFILRRITDGLVAASLPNMFASRSSARSRRAVRAGARHARQT